MPDIIYVSPWFASMVKKYGVSETVFTEGQMTLTDPTEWPVEDHRADALQVAIWSMYQNPNPMAAAANCAHGTPLSVECEECRFEADNPAVELTLAGADLSGGNDWMSISYNCIKCGLYVNKKLDKGQPAPTTFLCCMCAAMDEFCDPTKYQRFGGPETAEERAERLDWHQRLVRGLNERTQPPDGRQREFVGRFVGCDQDHPMGGKCHKCSGTGVVRL